MVCRRPRRQCVHRYHLSLVFDCGAPWNSLLGWANLAHPAQCERTHARVLKTCTALQPLLFSSEQLVRIKSTTILYPTLQSVLHIRCCATQTWARSHVFPCVSDLLGFARLPTPIVMFACDATTPPSLRSRPTAIAMRQTLICGHFTITSNPPSFGCRAAQPDIVTHDLLPVKCAHPAAKPVPHM